MYVLAIFAKKKTKSKKKDSFSQTYAILIIYTLARELSIVDTLFKTTEGIRNQCYLGEEKVIHTTA